MTPENLHRLRRHIIIGAVPCLIYIAVVAAMWFDGLAIMECAFYFMLMVLYTYSIKGRRNVQRHFRAVFIFLVAFALVFMAGLRATIVAEGRSCLIESQRYCVMMGFVIPLNLLMGGAIGWELVSTFRMGPVLKAGPGGHSLGDHAHGVVYVTPDQPGGAVPIALQPQQQQQQHPYVYPQPVQQGPFYPQQPQPLPQQYQYQPQPQQQFQQQQYQSTPKYEEEAASTPKVEDQPKVEVPSTEGQSS